MNTNRAALPPGPRSSLWAALQYMRDPLDFYTRCAARYGDRFTVPTPAGPLLVLGDPADLRQFFALPPADFTRFAPETVVPLLGSRSLLVVSGEQHRRDRQLVAPLFAAERVRALGPTMRAATLDELARLPVRSTLRMQELAQRIALSIIVRALLGGESPARAQWQQAVLGCLQSLDPKLMLIPALRRNLLGFGPYARFMRSRDHLDALTFAEIHRRRVALSDSANPSAADQSSGSHGNHDLLDLLLSMRDETGQALTDREVRDQLLTLVLTGYETVGIAAAWAVYWLQQTPAVNAKLHAELALLGPDPSPEALRTAPYLDAVCSESLRLYPVVPEVVRKLLVPLPLPNLTIPAGVAVAACIARIHHHPTIYPNPQRFDPERFLSARRYAPHEYLPFAAGVRRCLGATLAQDELKIILGTLLSRYHITLREPTPVRPQMRHLAMAPRTGIRIELTHR